MQASSEQTTTSSLIIMRDEKPNLSDSGPLLKETSALLTEWGVKYSGIGNYWQVGTPQQIQGWILHLSVVISQLPALIKKVLPYLIKEDIPFKVVQNTETADRILNGYYGSTALAKLITIFPSNDQNAEDLASELIRMTNNYKGPSIPTDFCLCNIVYTRYGSISPIWVDDPEGRPVKHIYNERGELVPDPYTIPFTFPVGVSWPFHRISKPIISKPNKLINARYYPISVIRESWRGDITKAIYFKSLWNIRACVIKQGRRHMIADYNDRDVADRLRWQYEVCKQMVGVIPVPRIFDYFTENGDTYLAMEYVKGNAVWDWLAAIYNKRPWFDLAASDKTAILDILLQITSIVARLHQYGYLHRDITPGNFLITRGNKVIPIDLELSWPFLSAAPVRPFLLGTPGYMSPQQEAAEPPTKKDDIYSLGKMILVACTRLRPSKIPSQPTDLLSALSFLTGNKELGFLVSNCLQSDPVKRPDLDTLQTTLSSLNDDYKKLTSPLVATEPELASTDKLTWVVQAGINGLANPNLLNVAGHWMSVSASTSTTSVQSPEPEQIISHIGWYTGVAGPLWLLALAKSAGFDVEPCKDVYTKSWDFIQSHFSKFPTGQNPSLFHGGAGVALAITEGIQSGLISPDTAALSLLESCFGSTAEELMISHGIAGQGIALLQASSSLPSHFVEPLLAAYVGKLCKLQQPDGSWAVERTGSNKNGISLRLHEGTAGIIWFLLSCLQYTPDKEVEATIRKALDWLINEKVAKQFLKRAQMGKIGIAWFSAQTPGDITILLIKAYKILGDQHCKLLAERNLASIPNHPLSSNFSLNSGLTRIGELYLEAFVALGDDHYLKKASWIADLFGHTFLQNGKKAGSWNMKEGTSVSADLFEGNSGIIHFLLRYLKPNEIPFPFY